MGRPLRVDGPRGARWDDCGVARQARTAEAAALERSTDSVNGSLALRPPLPARGRTCGRALLCLLGRDRLGLVYGARTGEGDVCLCFLSPGFSCFCLTLFSTRGARPIT